MNALTPAERAELPGLFDALIADQPAVRELANGYELKFKAGKNVFPVAAKWLSAESRCCPFFDIAISRSRDDGVMLVRLEGPSGVKEFIAKDLPKLHRLVSAR
jgi:hypothetical protein